MTGSRQTDTRTEELAATLRRLVSDIVPVLESDPHRALNLARRAAKWILRQLFGQAYVGTSADASAELRYGELCGLVLSAGFVPRRIQVQFQAIETFGTGDDHTDSDLTRGDVLPCLHALNTIVRWYLEDHLGSRQRITLLPDTEVTTAVVHARGRGRRPPWRSASRHRPPRLWRILAGFLSLLVAGIFLLHLWEVEITAGRRLGLVMDDSPAGVRVTEVLAEGPAELGGLEVGDVLLEVAGYQLVRTEDYDIPAASFVRDSPVSFRVRRGDQLLTLGPMVPGVPVDWSQPAIRGLVMLFCLALAALTLYRGPGDLRGRLLGIFLFLLAIELSLPEMTIGEVWLEIALTAYFYLSTGFQVGIELHIASVIPERQRWLARHRWVVPLFYAVTLGWGAAAGLTALLETVPRYWGRPELGELAAVVDDRHRRGALLFRLSPVGGGDPAAARLSGLALPRAPGAAAGAAGAPGLRAVVDLRLRGVGVQPPRAALSRLARSLRDLDVSALPAVDLGDDAARIAQSPADPPDPGAEDPSARFGRGDLEVDRRRPRHRLPSHPRLRLLPQGAHRRDDPRSLDRRPRRCAHGAGRLRAVGDRRAERRGPGLP